MDGPILFVDGHLKSKTQEPQLQTCDILMVFVQFRKIFQMALCVKNHSTAPFVLNKVISLEDNIVLESERLETNLHEFCYHDVISLRSEGGPQAIDEFKFKFPDEIRLNFPFNGIGTILISRYVKINAFLEILAGDRVDRPIERVPHYFPGPKGNGKSIWLALVGRALQKQGRRVFHIKHSGYLNRMKIDDFVGLGSPSDPVYLLVDEVQANPSDYLWAFLLKEENTGIVVIGAGIPSDDETSPAFNVRHKPHELFLCEDYLDEVAVTQIAGMLKNRPTDTAIAWSIIHAVRGLLRWLLSYTNGHSYPMLKLAEHIITEHPELCLSGGYETVVGSSAFLTSRAWQEIVQRSYSLSV